jgi:hypothetical protein
VKIKGLGFFICLLVSLYPGAEETASQKKIKTIVFKEQTIEGKIRRPQLVLIKAEQRPDFTPMVIQSMGKNMEIVEWVSQDVIEQSPYSKAFEFQDTRIVNYSP